MTLQDRTLVQQQFSGGFIDTAIEQVNFYNEASNGAILFADNAYGGPMPETSYWEYPDDLISVRDVNGTDAVTAVSGREKTTKGAREPFRYSPLKLNRSSITMKNDSAIRGGTEDGLDLTVGMFGGEVARQLTRHRWRQAVSILVNTLRSVPSIYYDASAQSGGIAGNPADWTNSVEALAQASFMHGESTGMANVLIGPSQAQEVLVQDYLVNYRETLRPEHVMGGALGISTLDVSALGYRWVTSNQPQFYPNWPDTSEYYVLMLTPGAIVIENSEEAATWMDQLIGYENLAWAIQGEGSSSYTRRGFSYNGPDFPSLASEVTASSNWSRDFVDDANLGGILLHLTTP